VKSGKLTLLLKVVEALEAVCKMDSKAILCQDYSRLCVYSMFKREIFMTSPWFAE
jgi:hypothetical protein